MTPAAVKQARETARRIRDDASMAAYLLPKYAARALPMAMKKPVAAPAESHQIPQDQNSHSSTLDSLEAGMESGVYALIGAAVGGMIGLVGALVNNHYANKRHVRELCFKSGLEHWKKDIDTAFAQNLRSPVLPLEDYLLNMMLIADLLIEKHSTSPQKLEEGIRRVDEIMTHLNRVRTDIAVKKIRR